jgi:ATP-binding cassette subfamily B protein
VLREGKVVEQGSHEELVKTQGVYSHMWEEYHQAITWQIKAEGVS